MAAAAVALVALLLSTDLHAPPRYDGAGYSVLALAIKSGKGYREIAVPVERPHGHFPPAYPLVLAGLWTITGRSVEAAHWLSIACTTLAVWLAIRWFFQVERRWVAIPLGFALAMNWTWLANGGVIQSEPLFLLLSMLALNLAGRRGVWASAIIGLILGLAILTRHVGVCLAAAVIFYEIVNKRWRDGLITAFVCGLVILPWILWLASLEGRTQAGLFQRDGLLQLIAGQTLFYARRIPDALAGPFVEVATVFLKSRVLGTVATTGAIAVTSVILLGYFNMMRTRRQRLAGLAALFTLTLLLVWPFTEAGRFLVPLVPLLLLGAVEGARFIGKRSRIAWLLLIVAIPYPMYSLASGRASAARHTHDEFDAACGWIAREAKQDGPVMTRHPGEVFWQTGRKGIEPATNNVHELLKEIEDQNVAYLLVDPERFANAPETPLARLVRECPERFVRTREGTVEVYAVKRDQNR